MGTSYTDLLYAYTFGTSSDLMPGVSGLVSSFPQRSSVVEAGWVWEVSFLAVVQVMPVCHTY